MDNESTNETHRIVVGVDGSKDSIRALEWAAHQAELTNASVEIVTTWKLPISYGWATAPTDYNPAADVQAELDHIVTGVRSAHPTVTFDVTIEQGDAALHLLDRSKYADLLVLGTRGHGGFVGLVAGSVSIHCVTNATCPVVVIRAQP